jgi:UDP-N-acetylglucosamine acyltransferase
MTRMVQDVPPYVIIEGYAGRVRGVNVIGLKRAMASEADIEALRVIFKRIYRTGSPRRKVLSELSREPHDRDLVQHLVRSLNNTEIGLKGRFRESMREEFARLGAERILARSATP